MTRTKPEHHQRLLIIGGTGFVGARILSLASDATRVFAVAFRSPEGTGRERWIRADDPIRVAPWIAASKPDCIINAAALSAISACEEDPEAARILNTKLPARLAEEADRRRIRLIHLSTDQVDDGTAVPPRNRASGPPPPRPRNLARPTSIRDFHGIPRSPNTVFDGTRSREVLETPPRSLESSLAEAFTP